jgi:cytosine/adenosine deaminase-related metal-dependent hydrolase
VVERAVICVSQEGVIEWIAKDEDGTAQDVASRHGVDIYDVDVVECPPGSFLCPGLIDTHTVCRRATLSRWGAIVLTRTHR